MENTIQIQFSNFPGFLISYLFNSISCPLRVLHMYVVKCDHIDPSLFFMVLGVEPRVLLLPDALSLRCIPGPDMIMPRNTPLVFNEARVLPHSKPGAEGKYPVPR